MARESRLLAETGPYLQAALICEYTLREHDGVVSLIRVIDRIIHTQRGPTAPHQMPPLTHRLNIVVMLKAGETRGAYDLSLRLEDPSGIIAQQPLITQRILFEGGPDHGHHLQLDGHVTFQSAGLYWFHVSLDDGSGPALLTKIPVRIVYSRTQTAGGSAPTPGG